MNNWGIPDWLEDKIRKRDKFCVYCHIKLKEHRHTKSPRRQMATWEHIDNNNLRAENENNICRCCTSCNSSKGEKKLSAWFDSEYCEEKNINGKTVSEFVRTWLRNHRRSQR